MNVPTLEEEYLAGEISTNDFLYLLLARTEMEIIQTDLSQTESDRDLVECCIPTLRNSSQTQINKTGEYNFIQRDRKYVDYESIYNRLSKCEGYRKQKLAQKQASFP